MVTAAVLGAAVGLGGALVLALAVLIYHYHAAQRKQLEFDSYYSNKMERETSHLASSSSYRHRGSSTTSYKSSSNSLHIDGNSTHGNIARTNIYSTSGSGSTGSSAKKKHQLFLPLIQTHQDFTTTADPVQPNISSLTPFKMTTTISQTTTTTTMSTTAANSKRSSPLSYFSLDIPSRLMSFGTGGSSSNSGAAGGDSTSSSTASSATSPSMLPHQSFSLPPFVSRFVRSSNVPSLTSTGDTPTTTSSSSSLPTSAAMGISSFNRPPSAGPPLDHSLHPMQHHSASSATASTPLLSRSPSPCRPHQHHHAPPASATSTVFAFVHASATANSTNSSSPSSAPASAATIPAANSGNSGCANSPPSSNVSPAIQLRRNRSPMLCSLAKMNSVQSSTSNSTQGSQGSSSSLFGNTVASCIPPPPNLQPPTTPTPLGALQPELYKREKTIHVGLPSNNMTDEQPENDFMYPDPPSTSSLSSTSSRGTSCIDGGATTDCSSAGRRSWASRSNSQQQRSSISSTQGRNSSSSVSFGRLHFRLAYDFDKSDLLVHLVEVCDVLPVTEGGTAGGVGAAAGSTSSSSGGSCSSSNGASGTSGSAATAAFREAHVRLTLLPEVDQRRRQTKNTIRIDLTGGGGGGGGQTGTALSNRHSIDEHFKFPVSHDHLDHKTLRFQICDYDRFSRPRVMGDLQFSLAERDVSTSAVDIWAEMMRNTLPDESRPQLLISLSYLPSAERLTVVVLKAKNLVIPPNKTNIDPLVKLYLMVNGKRHKKKKSECRKGTKDPVWNQALAFTVPSPKLNSCSLQISVVDHGTDRGKNVLLGCITLGPEEDAASPQRQHWQDMAHNVRKSVAMWHFLQ